MAHSKDNILVHGFSGKIGNLLVFRQAAGKTIATKRPIMTATPTDNQMAVRTKFQSAVIYGRMVSSDPSLKEEYKAATRPGTSAYNVAIADFFSAPDILEIDVSNYSGDVGDTITIKVTDDFKVKKVRVMIQNEEGTIIEEGDAVNRENKVEWVYTATVMNTDLSGDKISVFATDNPDNLTREDRALS